MCRLGLIDSRNRFCGCRDTFEIFLGPAERFFGFEIADDDEGRVVRLVEGIEEFADVFDRGFVEIGHASNRGVVIAVDRECSCAKVLFEQAVWLIIHADAALFLHYFALGLEIRFVHVEAAHTVGLEPEDALEIIAREGLEEIRVVVVRAGVIESAGGFDDARMLIGPDVRGAFEHQVLEEMREAGVAGLLVFCADVIPDLQVDHGSGMVFEQNHLQAIGKRVRGEVKLRRPNLFRFVLFLLRSE